MLSLNDLVPVFVAVGHVDFRLGIDGLVAKCRALLSGDPMSGAVFVFCNRKRNAIKLLHYDGQGFWLAHKRWSQGRLTWWPDGQGASVSLPARELQILLYNGHPKRAQMSQDWSKVAA